MLLATIGIFIEKGKLTSVIVRGKLKSTCKTKSVHLIYLLEVTNL